MHGGDIYRNKVKTDYSVSLNPLGAPGEVLAAVRRAADRAGEYPDPKQEAVRNSLAKALSLQSEQVLAGSGASALLLAAVRAAAPKKALLFTPCFSGYAHVLSAAGCAVIAYKTKPETDFCVNAADLTAEEQAADLWILCDPASPSGRNLPEPVLRQLLDQAKAGHKTVLLDESFYALSDGAQQDKICATHTKDRTVQAEIQTYQTENKTGSATKTGDRSTDLIREYDNLLVIRSLTKILALPGIRMGYAIGAPEKISALKGQLPEWDLSVAAEEAIQAGMQVLAKTDFLAHSHQMIKAERAYLTEGLRGLGLTVFESEAPYILFQAPEDLYEKLIEKEILIRDCRDYEGLRSGYYRIGIKTRPENEALLAAIRGSLHAF